MGMTFADLKSRFEALTGISDCANEDLMVWLNEGQLDLALVAGRIVRQQYSDVLAGEELELPERFLRVEDCDRVYRLTPDGKIIFGLGGEVSLYYRQLPAEFPLFGEGVCEINPLFQDLLPLFAASRYWDRESEGDGEESNHGTKWLKQYLDGKAKRLKALGLWDQQLEQWTVE